MSNSLVTLATFSKPTDAYLALGKLQADGIEGFVHHDNWVTMSGDAASGIKLNVKGSDVQRAMEILREDLSAIADIDDSSPPGQPAVQCPLCQTPAGFLGKIRRLYFLSWLSGFPLPLQRRFVCSNCGHRWKRR